MNFVAIDFETANADLSSICQVGMVTFRDGEPFETFSSLIDPDDYFDPINSLIHGLTEESIHGAPTFASIYSEICRRAQGTVMVSHSLFDRAALVRASMHHNLAMLDCPWLDTMRVVRRAWSQYSRSGYGLANLATDFGIQFKHHNAAEDARVTGLILVQAMRQSGMTLDEWLVRASLPLTQNQSIKIQREGNTDGPLAGEFAVFTGTLSMPRHEAADLAAQAGCTVEAAVTKATTLLIVGDQDVTRLAPGHTKSGKHLKAEALIAKGQPIRILRETDFLNITTL